MLILGLVAISPLIVKILLDTSKNDYLNYDKKNIKENKYILIFLGIITVLIMGLRDRYAGTTDTDNYCKGFLSAGKYDSYFEYINTCIKESGWLFSELGFYSCNYMLAQITSNYQILIFLSSLFITYSVYRFIYKNSQDVILSVAMYICLGMFTFNMNGMRQALAMSICLWAYEFIKEKKPIKFLIVVFVAMLFHKTAIIFGLCYFIKYLKFDFKSLSIFLLILLAVVVFNSQIVTFFDDIYDKNYAEGESFLSGGIAQIAIYVLVVLSVIINLDCLKSENNKNIFFMSILAIFFFVLRFIGTQVFERISYYFAFYTVLLLPSSLSNLQSKEKSFVSVIIMIVSILLFIYRISSGIFVNFVLCF